MLDLAGFRLMFPELTAREYPDAKVTQALEDADLLLAGRTTTARLKGLVAAHLLTGEGLLPIEKNTEGPVSTEFEYSGERPTAKYWIVTSYGRLYLQLIRANPNVAIGAHEHNRTG